MSSKRAVGAAADCYRPAACASQTVSALAKNGGFLSKDRGFQWDTAGDGEARHLKKTLDSANKT